MDDRVSSQHNWRIPCNSIDVLVIVHSTTSSSYEVSSTWESPKYDPYNAFQGCQHESTTFSIMKDKRPTRIPYLEPTGQSLTIKKLPLAEEVVARETRKDRNFQILIDWKPFTRSNLVQYHLLVYWWMINIQQGLKKDWNLHDKPSTTIPCKST